MEAWATAYAIRRWSIWNMLLWFKPPFMHSVAIIPERMDLVDPEEKFEQSMFRPSGTFYTTPLNHYIRLRVSAGRDEFWANAAILYQEFRISRRRGYAALKELIVCAKKELAQARFAEECLSLLQEKSSSLGGRDTGVPGGVDHTGE